MPKCKDCIHSEICASHLKAVRDIYGAVMSISGREVNRLESALSEISITIGQICCDDCDHFHDSSRFVELPCKIGDTLYTVVRGYKIREWIVTDICFSDYLPRSVKVFTARDKQNSEHMRFVEHYLGKNIFLTREAAEQALKERES